MGSKIYIRLFKADDADSIIDLFKNAVAAINIRHYSPEQVAEWTTIDRKKFVKSLGEHVTFVAEINSTIVGFADLRQDGYLDRLFIHKDFQGQFVSLHLLRAVEDAARTLGLTKIFTNCSITAKIPAKRAGFKVITEQTVTKNGVQFINYVMEKHIELKESRKKI